MNISLILSSLRVNLENWQSYTKLTAQHDLQTKEYYILLQVY